MDSDFFANSIFDSIAKSYMEGRISNRVKYITEHIKMELKDRLSESFTDKFINLILQKIEVKFISSSKDRITLRIFVDYGYLDKISKALDNGTLRSKRKERRVPSKHEVKRAEGKLNSSELLNSVNRRRIKNSSTKKLNTVNRRLIKKKKPSEKYDVLTMSVDFGDEKYDLFVDFMERGMS